MNGDEAVADLVIFKRHNRAYIVSETTKGKVWMETNLILDPNTKSFAIQAEELADFTKNLDEEEITHDIR